MAAVIEHTILLADRVANPLWINRPVVEYIVAVLGAAAVLVVAVVVVVVVVAALSRKSLHDDSLPYFQEKCWLPPVLMHPDHQY
jgi:flagellar biosynthesis/type III secretory pathway M-ring protein FliF/YscJ